MEKYYKKWFKPLLLPAVILFVGVIIIPFIIGVFYSFSAWRGTYFHGGANAFESFVGLRNYAKVFQNSQFLDALIYTLKFTLMAVIAVSVAVFTVRSFLCRTFLAGLRLALSGSLYSRSYIQKCYLEKRDFCIFHF